ncbi:hypothetical protein ES705_32358 [subsurface metagenome]
MQTYFITKRTKEVDADVRHKIFLFDRPRCRYLEGEGKDIYDQYNKWHKTKECAMKKPPSPPDHEASLASAVARAKRGLSDLIYFGHCQQSKFLTLTFAESCCDRSKVKSAVHHMCTRYKAGENQPLAYISVLELHPGGHGYHVHMIINSPYVPQSTWQDDYWQKGIVHIKSLARVSTTAGVIDITNYLCKYLEKDAPNVPSGSRRYNVSQAWPELPKRQYLDFGSYEEAFEWFSKLGNKYNTWPQAWESYTSNGEVVAGITLSGKLPPIPKQFLSGKDIEAGNALPAL